MKLHVATTNGIDKGKLAVADGDFLKAESLENELTALNGLGGSTDASEVVLTSFVRWGADFPLHLKVTTFAAAVFDMDANRLILCRDRFGTIPLYYAETRDGLAFGSRTDEFLDSGAVPRKADLQAVWDYLTLGVVPQHRTMISGVHSLGPGEFLEYDFASRSCKVRRWWRLAPDESLEKLSYDEAKEQLHDAIGKALSDLDLRNALLLLSGGLDSATLLAAMSEQQKSVRTLTLGYENRHQAFDESSRAKRLAEHFDADAKFVTISDWDAAKHFAKFMKAMDQPSRDGFNMYFATKAAHDCGATAVLTGLGGDELFESYPHLIRRLKAEQSGKWLRFAAPLMRRLPDRFRHNLMLPFLSRAESLETIRAQVYEEGKRLIVNPELLEGRPAPQPWLEHCREVLVDGESLARCIARFDVELDMEHTLLRDAFLQSSANQVTPLSPLIDERVAVLAFSLPTAYKIRDGRKKAVLTDAFGDKLPEDVRRAPKHGFEMPLLAWLGGPLLPKAKEAFASPQAAMLFKRQYCLNWSERLASLQPRDYPLWSRFILLEWMMARNITDIR